MSGAGVKQRVLALPGARQGVDSLRRWGDRLVRVRADRVVRRDLSAAGFGGGLTAGFQVSEHEYFDDATFRVHQQVGRPYDREMLEAQMARRARQGLRLFALSRGDVALATAWISPELGRSLEDHGLVISVPAGHLWLIDVYVSEQGRGRGLFGTLAQLVIDTYFSEASVLWSDVSVGNASSLAAHRKAGFEDVGGIRSVHLAGALLVRRYAFPAALSVGGFKAGRRVVTTGVAYRRFVGDCGI